MPYRPRYLSHSAIDCYARCPALYHRRYVQGVVDPPTPAMAFGKCFAVALEAEHRGQDGDVAWVRAYATAQQNGELPVGSPTIQHGLALLARYRQRGVGQGEPEREFLLPLPNPGLVPVPIRGFLDLATADEVWEFKTSAGAWDQGRADNSAQASVYRWAFTQLYHRKPQCVRFLVFSTRAVALEEFCTYPAGPELRLFELRAAATWRGIRDREFPPTCQQASCPACVEAGVAKGPPERPEGLTLTWP